MHFHLKSLSFKVSSGSRSHFSVVAHPTHTPTPDMGTYTRMKGLVYNDQGSHHNLTGNSKDAVLSTFPEALKMQGFSRNPH